MHVSPPLRMFHIMNTMILGLFCASTALASPGAAQDGSGPNVLTNSDFTHGAQSWRLEQIPPSAATLEILGQTASPSGLEGRPVRINVTAIGAEKWQPQFFQTGLDLLEGEPYTLAFWARADSPRRISLNANVDTNDGHGIGLTVDGVTLTSDWRKYAYTFTPAKVIKDHCRITFLLGEMRGPVSLAGIALRRGKHTLTMGPDLLRDGQFSSGNAYWKFETKPPADGAMDVQPRSSAPPGVASMVAHFHVKEAGQENWHVQATQTGLDLDQGENYTLSFWARADRSRPLTIVASLDMPDWHRIAPDTSLSLTPEWKKLTLTFTAAHTVPKHSRIVFVLGDATGTVDLADVSLKHEVLRELVVASRPREETPRHPLVGSWESAGMERLRFTFNVDGTGSIRSITQGTSAGVPTARVANAFRWYMNESNPREVVIGKEAYRWSLSRTGATDRLILTDGTGKAHSLLRR